MVNLNDDQSTTTPSDKFTDPVTIHLMQIRRKLIDRHAPAFYLGDPARNFKHQVVWKQVGNDKQLVASAVEQMEETQLAVLTSEPSAGLTSIVPIDPLVKPVLLSTIVFIDFDNCWLTPCGFWKGRTNATEKFEDIKLSFQGKAPPKEFLSQDFSTFIKNTKMLMDDASLGGANSSGFLVTTKKGENAIQLQHILFEKIDSTSDDESETASDWDDTWTMANWPVKSYEAEIECNKLLSTHRPIPLPAYDIDGHLIAPEACKNMLAGAIARVIFTMNHCFIDNNWKECSSSTNCFVADVQSIRVLVKPESLPYLEPSKK